MRRAVLLMLSSARNSESRWIFCARYCSIWPATLGAWENRCMAAGAGRKATSTPLVATTEAERVVLLIRAISPKKSPGTSMRRPMARPSSVTSITCSWPDSRNSRPSPLPPLCSTTSRLAYVRMRISALTRMISSSERPDSRGILRRWIWTFCCFSTPASAAVVSGWEALIAVLAVGVVASLRQPLPAQLQLPVIVLKNRNIFRVAHAARLQLQTVAAAQRPRHRGAPDLGRLGACGIDQAGRIGRAAAPVLLAISQFAADGTANRAPRRHAGQPAVTVAAGSIGQCAVCQPRHTGAQRAVVGPVHQLAAQFRSDRIEITQRHIFIVAERRRQSELGTLR